MFVRQCKTNFYERVRKTTILTVELFLGHSEKTLFQPNVCFFRFRRTRINKTNSPGVSMEKKFLNERSMPSISF